MATDRSYVAENQAQLARLRALVDSLTDAELAQPMPAGWTVAGVLAHLAYWDQRIVVLMDRWGPEGKGSPPTAAVDDAARLQISHAGLGRSSPSSSPMLRHKRFTSEPFVTRLSL